VLNRALLVVQGWVGEVCPATRTSKSAVFMWMSWHRSKLHWSRHDRIDNLTPALKSSSSFAPLPVSPLGLPSTSLLLPLIFYLVDKLVHTCHCLVHCHSIRPSNPHQKSPVSNAGVIFKLQPASSLFLYPLYNGTYESRLQSLITKWNTSPTLRLPPRVVGQPCKYTRAIISTTILGMRFNHSNYTSFLCKGKGHFTLRLSVEWRNSSNLIGGEQKFVRSAFTLEGNR
jgi:hypothetical protein